MRSPAPRPLRWHHARPLAQSPYAVVQATRPRLGSPCFEERPCDRSDDWHEAIAWQIAYDWLASRVGFQPIFVAVGCGDDDRQMTGYSNQWLRRLPAAAPGEGRAEKWPSTVMFSFASEPGRAVYSDFDWWHCVLNAALSVRCHAGASRGSEPTIGVTRHQERMIFKRSWSRSRWLAKAAAEPGAVQAVTPELDLRVADEVWCRNQASRREFVQRGFAPDRVRVRRLPVLHD